MYLQPPFLKKKDKVAIIATAKNFEIQELAPALEILKSWGVEVLLGKNVYHKFNQFAGTDEERLEDLQWALDHKEIKVIFCARGGYGSSRIIDQVNLAQVKKNPKWLVGFSDVTVIHGLLQKAGIQSIHGIMPVLFSKPGSEESIQKLKDILFGKKSDYKIAAHFLDHTGRTEAMITGGNLSILCSIIGTKTDIDTRDKILFMEDVGENLYRIDRMMIQMKRAGKLDRIKGLVVGHFSDMEDNKISFGKTAYEIIYDAVKEYNYPICFGFPAGHESENLPLVFGENYSLQVTASGTKIK